VTAGDSKVTVKTELLSPLKPFTSVGLRHVVTEVTVTLHNFKKVCIILSFFPTKKKLFFFLA